MSGANKNTKVQILRAIAIIAVVLIHTCKGGYYQVFCRPFINYAVALFVFLSGYLTKLENDDWKCFIYKRIKRVVIPYFIWTIIYTLPSADLYPYLYNLLTTEASAVLYYIFVYIQLVILTPVIGKLAKSKYRSIGFLITPLVIIGYKYSSLIFNWHPHRYIEILWLFNCFSWFSYYYLGIILGNKLMQCKCRIETLIILYGFSLVLQVVEAYILYHCYNDLNSGSQVKLTVFLSNIIFILLAYIYLSNSRDHIELPILTKIGDYSFGIYLSHMMVIKCLCCTGPLYNSIPFVVNSAIVFLLSFATAYIGRKVFGYNVSRVIGFI